MSVLTLNKFYDDMKKIIIKSLLLISIIGILVLSSCGVSKKTQQTKWYEIGKNNPILIEVVRDTIDVKQLDSICKVHNIKSNLNKWTIMRHYNNKNDYINQWLYTCGENTIYTVTSYNTYYIFTKRITQEIKK